MNTILVYNCSVYDTFCREMISRKAIFVVTKSFFLLQPPPMNFKENKCFVKIPTVLKRGVKHIWKYLVLRKEIL